MAGWMLVLEGRAIRDPTSSPETHQRITSHEKGPGGLAKPFLFLYRIRKISTWGCFHFRFLTVLSQWSFSFSIKADSTRTYKTSILNPGNLWSLRGDQHGLFSCLVCEVTAMEHGNGGSSSPRCRLW